jgi:hypothetical protein
MDRLHRKIENRRFELRCTPLWMGGLKTRGPCRHTGSGVTRARNAHRVTAESRRYEMLSGHQ